MAEAEGPQVDFGRLAFALAAVCFGSAALLVGVNSQTAPMVAANQAKKTRQARMGVLPAGTAKVDTDAEKLTLDLASDWEPNTRDLKMILSRPVEQAKKIDVFRGYDEGGAVTGFAMVFELPDGYSGNITFMMGVAFDEGSNRFQITGAKILDHKETPGLGANIVQVDYAEKVAAQKEDRDPVPNFLAQYKGLSAERMVLEKDTGKPEDIDSLTAATITSRAFTDAAKRVLEMCDRNKDALRRPVQARGPATSGDAAEGRG